MALHRFYPIGFYRLDSNKWKLSRHLKIKCYFCTVQNHLPLLTISISFSCILLSRSVGLSIKKYCWVFSVFCSFTHRLLCSTKSSSASTGSSIRGKCNTIDFSQFKLTCKVCLVEDQRSLQKDVFKTTFFFYFSLTESL